MVRSPVPSRRARRPGTGSLKTLAVLALLAPWLGCGGDPSPVPEVSYVAQLIVAGEHVRVQLVRVTFDGVSQVTMEEAGVRELPIPGMKFSVDAGSVPDSVAGVAPECHGRTDLGTDDAGPCFSAPLLGTFDPFLAEMGLEKSDVTVLLTYATDGDEAYDLEDVAGLDEKVSDFLEQLGYRVGGGG